MNKIFYTQNNIGHAKYCVSCHDGIHKHPDGSDFYDIAIFKNKKKLNVYINNLLSNGYKER